MISDAAFPEEMRQELTQGKLSKRTLTHLAKLIDENSEFAKQNQKKFTIAKMETTADDSGERKQRLVKHFGSITTTAMVVHKYGVLRVCLGSNDLVILLNEVEPELLQHAFAEICAQKGTPSSPHPGIIKVKPELFKHINFIEKPETREDLNRRVILLQTSKNCIEYEHIVRDIQKLIDKKYKAPLEAIVPIKEIDYLREALTKLRDAWARELQHADAESEKAEAHPPRTAGESTVGGYDSDSVDLLEEARVKIYLLSNTFKFIG